MLFGGVRGAIYIGDDNTLDVVLDLVAAAQVLAEGGEIEPERLLRHRLFGRLILFRRGLHRLLGILKPAERNFFGFFRALADDNDFDLFADRGVGHHARQILRLLDVLAVEFYHHVARLDAGGLCGTLLLDTGDQRAARGLDAETFGDFVGDLLDADPEPAAAKLAELAQRIHHADHGLGGHREADADRAAGRRDDQRVDAYDLAVEIEQRAAGIAAIDRGVGLDVAVVRSGIDVAVAGRNDARGNRATEAERVADRDHPFAEPQLVGIAEFHRDQRFRRRREFQHRQIGLLVDPDQRRLDLGAVVHDDVDFVGVGNDVIVGHGDA